VRTTLRALGLQSIGGLVVWTMVASVAVAVDSAALDIVTVLLLFAQLVIVPLGLLLVPGDPLVRGARYLFRLGAVAALASLAIPRGELSAAVAAIYLLPALLVGAASLLRVVTGLRAGSVRQPAHLSEIVAGGFLAAGAVAFVLHRQDAAFSGFPEFAIHLTAVHFHVAGFGLMLMAGELARRRAAMGGTAVALILVGMILIPIGIMTSPLVELAGALFVVAALLVVSVGTFTTLGDAEMSAGARRALFASATFGFVVGGMAGAYVIGDAVGSPLIPVELMARMHGAFAAVGVVFFGLFGWRLAARS
jgi:hypothetical protein